MRKLYTLMAALLMAALANAQDVAPDSRGGHSTLPAQIPDRVE